MQLSPSIKNLITKDTIDLWFESLDTCELNYRYYWALLDSSERAKSMRFASELDRRRFVVSHGKLRRILARYLLLPPDKIVFETQSQGKPFVTGDRSDTVKFNLSHSDSYLLVGISSDYEIGVDIEIWKDIVDYEGVLDLCFSDSERSFWRELSAEQRQAFFYRQWVRKESFVKAVGLGLELDISLVETTLTGIGRFLSLPTECGLPENWSLIALELVHGMSAAITIHSRNAPSINYKSLL